eukprot:28834-Karenia_brevis.AAC.1
MVVLTSWLLFATVTFTVAVDVYLVVVVVSDIVSVVCAACVVMAVCPWVVWACQKKLGYRFTYIPIGIYKKSTNIPEDM